MRCSNAGTGGAVAQGGRWHEGAVQKQGEGPLELLAVLVIIRARAATARQSRTARPYCIPKDYYYSFSPDTLTALLGA